MQPQLPTTFQQQQKQLQDQLVTPSTASTTTRTPAQHSQEPPSKRGLRPRILWNKKARLEREQAEKRPKRSVDWTEEVVLTSDRAKLRKETETTEPALLPTQVDPTSKYVSAEDEDYGLLEVDRKANQPLPPKPAAVPVLHEEDVNFQGGVDGPLAKDRDESDLQLMTTIPHLSKVTIHPETGLPMYTFSVHGSPDGKSP